MYFVQEHLYYIEGKAGPILEYCVCEAEVTGFFQGGFTEICLKGYSPKGYMTPYRYKLSDIGKKVFYTPKEAAELAKRMTDVYEHTWGWLGEPDIPMRRTWEPLLRSENNQKKTEGRIEHGKVN